MQTFDGDMSSTHYQFIFLVFPWLGALIAVFLYEVIFKKVEEGVVAEEAIEDHEDMQEQLVEAVDAWMTATNENAYVLEDKEWKHYK